MRISPNERRGLDGYPDLFFIACHFYTFFSGLTYSGYALGNGAVSVVEALRLADVAACFVVSATSWPVCLTFVDAC
jgi:hypothetical protein